uniref:baculoviral IAP repeat-containing protein 7 isoform X1 n=1 Tax=Ciona intestinalis TaxID=7719 RepID=UPI000180B4E5|nr:baculoviral IAP repeat-containing protein 7 isoform X1 [Ciona intestinalis]|eukprot:XP_002130256.1 baculoviral IAP repeat-containing protein 7 isoform X1 [Ciona intestinalis]
MYTVGKSLNSARVQTSVHSSPGLHHDIEVDGRIFDRPKDPPGQRSHYILPGDTEREVYRITTYKLFPLNCPIDIMLLSRHGFYYTGYKDRVKCFSCGLSVENWMVGDDPTSDRWHFDTCELALGTDDRNIRLKSINGDEKVKFTRSGSPSQMPQEGSIQNMVASHSANGCGELNQAAAPPRQLVNVGSDRAMHQPQAADAATPDHVAQMLSNTHINKATPKPPLPQTAKYVPPFSNKNPGFQFASIVDIEHKKYLMSIELFKEENRRETFKTWSAAFNDEFVKELARSGFFYLGNLDRTQCFSCSGVLRNWRASDDVNVEHFRHFPHCKMGSNSESKNVPLPLDHPIDVDDIPEPPDPSPKEQEDLVKMFTLGAPMNPHMRSLDARVATFDRRWPARKVKASATHIAKAGFYFLGDRDRAKCWYCNGGLQNWDANDEPWVEHAKWFPGCEFVLRNKGISFVHEIYTNNPNLNRPEIQNARSEYLTSPKKNGGVMISQTATITAGEVLANYLPPPPPDGVERSPETGSATDVDAMMKNEVVSVVTSMGFGHDLIRKAVEKHISNNGSNPPTTEGLLELILQLDENDDVIADDVINGDVMQDDIGAIGGIVISQGEGVETKSSLKRNNDKAEQDSDQKPMKQQKFDTNAFEELESLEMERRCRACRNHVADTVVMPCGHLCFCSSCSSSSKRCGLCREKIQSVMKVYLS